MLTWLPRTCWLSTDLSLEPIVASFINAFKNGATSVAGMTLPTMTPSGQSKYTEIAHATRRAY